MPTLAESMEREADIAEALAVRREVMRLDLSRPGIFDAITDYDFAEIYNGYGPDSWPEKLRAAITWVYRNFKPLAAVHDVEFEFSDGTRIGWLISLHRWHDNSVILLNDRYPLSKFWLVLFRANAWGKLRASYAALKCGSWGAWQAAYERGVDGRGLV